MYQSSQLMIKIAFSENKKNLFFTYFSCSLYMYARVYVRIWTLRSQVDASRPLICMLTRQKQQLHVHRLFQLMGTCRKISDIFMDHYRHVRVL